METQKKELPFSGSQGKLSEQTLAIHHDKLYVGYVNKKDQIQNSLQQLSEDKLNESNATYSELRALKTDETFAVNGVYLHEWYFENLGGDGTVPDELKKKIADQFGSFEKFIQEFSSCGIAARGWVILAWDLHDNQFRIYNADAHNQGGVWGAIPLLIMDVYEHAYFIDYGSDRKSYIADFISHINWKPVEKRYLAAQQIQNIWIR